MSQSAHISEKEYNRRIKEIELLLHLNEKIIRTLDLDVVLQMISDGMAELFEIETAAIYLLEDNDRLFLGATTPPLDPSMPDGLRWARIEDHPNIQSTLKNLKAHVIPDTSKVELSPPEAQVVKLRKLRSLVFLPIIDGETVIGVLILGTNNKARVYSDYEVELSQGIANQLSLGIVNARLHTELLQHNDELQQSIKERIEAEETLKENRVELSNALRIAKLGHWEYDVLKDQFLFTDEFYEAMKTSAEEQGGYTMTAKQYAERFIPADQQHMVAMEIEAGMETNDPEYTNEVEHGIVYGDGSEGFVLVRIRILKDKNGRTVKFFGANQDLTAMKRHENELLAAFEKAKESDRLKSAFLANISHEIRTPLNAILGFSKFISKEDLSYQTREEYQLIIDLSGKRLLDIISNILDISKIDADQFTVHYNECNVNELVRDLIQQHSRQAEQKGLKIHVSSELGDKECSIRTDKTRLTQVLSNIVENALKFTDEGRIIVSYYISGDELEFSIKDSGIGIDPKDHEMIFGRFQQVDNEYTIAGTGSGLGLSIAKGIIKMLGGRIWVESEYGQGADFHITIPYELVLKMAEKEKSSRLAEISKKFKVLVAEDEESNYLYIKALLEHYDCEIIHAKNGKEVLTYFKEQADIDFILMDIKMPEINGLDATREIRNYNDTIPIVAQTAYAMEEDQHLAYEAGCDYYLPKPISPQRLTEIIARILSH
ncbi:ATP-binding protein [Bacteroidota bacterium]